MEGCKDQREQRPILSWWCRKQLDIHGEVTQNFEIIQEIIWFSPLPLNNSVYSFLPFFGLILNKSFVSDSNELLPND